jgi:hypothetical protein
LVDFIVHSSGVILRYKAEQAGNGWVWRDLRNHGVVALRRVFRFERRDLVAEPDEADAQDDFEAFEYDFASPCASAAPCSTRPRSFRRRSLGAFPSART